MIAAILLAAGESTRMGKPKLLLPWGDGDSMICHVLKRYLAAGLREIIVVTGAFRQEVESEIDDLPVQCVFNPQFAEGEMLSSLQLGIRRLEKTRASAALISPADIPDVKVETLLTIMRHWRDHGATLISPSYQRRGGHPILVGRPAWKEILSLVPGDTLRAFLRERDDQRAFVGVEDAGILRDIDTPGDYADAHPTGGE